MRLVLDTNVVVSGLIWGGPPRRLLDMGRRGGVFLFSSAILLDELAEVLARKKFAALLAARKIAPEFLMQRYGMLATLVYPVPAGRAEVPFLSRNRGAEVLTPEASSRGGLPRRAR